MKTLNVLLGVATVMGMYESVIDVLWEVRKMNGKYNALGVAREQKEFKDLEEIGKGITAIEVDAFNTMGNSEFLISETVEDIESARYFIMNCNKNLKHDSEQLVQVKEKRCFENNSFINKLVALKDSEETVNSLRKELEGYFETKNPIFLQELEKVVNTLTGPELLQTGYDLYSHPYEFDTSKRNENDNSRTPHALEYAKSQPLSTLDSDLSILLDNLHDFIITSTKDLENREIKTAHDIVTWELELQKESAQLLDEIERKKMHEQKLQRDKKRMEDLKNISNGLWEDSKLARKGLDEILKNFKKFENIEVQRRTHTDEAVEEALYVFETQFPEYAEYIRVKRGNE